MLMNNGIRTIPKAIVRMLSEVLQKVLLLTNGGLRQKVSHNLSNMNSKKSLNSLRQIGWKEKPNRTWPKLQLIWIRLCKIIANGSRNKEPKLLTAHSFLLIGLLVLVLRSIFKQTTMVLMIISEIIVKAKLVSFQNG